MELRTPLGCRDLLAKDVRRRKALCQRILGVFDSFGFEQVQSPAVEYYQTYNRAFSNLQDRMMLKMTDENMDLLALRLDMTVPIARLAATNLQNASLPLRLSYASDVWKARKAYSGKGAQRTDCGVELIGSNDDREILVCALEALEACALPGWTLELSDARLVDVPARMVFEKEEDRARLIELIDEKSMVELASFLDGHHLTPQQRRYFISLPLLDGSFEVLEEAMGLAFDPTTRQVLEELQHTIGFLEELGYGKKIRLDLGKLPHLNYYTGLIFEAFVPGAASAVLSGGRYDELMASFGRNLPAVGFAFKIDALASVLEDDQVRPILVIRYSPNQILEAFALAREERRKQPVRLMADEKAAGIELSWEERA